MGFSERTRMPPARLLRRRHSRAQCVATNGPEPVATRIFCRLQFPFMCEHPLHARMTCARGESHFVTQGAAPLAFGAPGHLVEHALHTRDFVSHRRNRVFEIVVHKYQSTSFL